jgi:hypothetical protein
VSLCGSSYFDGGIIIMSQKGPKDWRELCRKAAEELDPEKLMDLIVEINKALDEHYKKGKGVFENPTDTNIEKESRRCEAAFLKLCQGRRSPRMQFGALRLA